MVNTKLQILNESCFILIAPFDIFGRGLYRYTFEGVCRECPDLKLEDGALKVFINTEGTNPSDFSQEFLDFMEYIGKTTDETAGNTESVRVKRIHEKVKQIRKSEKAGLRFMQKWEELAYEREAGRAEGRAEGLEASILVLLENMEPVPMRLREEIMAETNEEILKKWLLTATRAGSIEEFMEKTHTGKGMLIVPGKKTAFSDSRRDACI